MSDHVVTIKLRRVSRSPTIDALFRRGVPYDTAVSIAESGLTLAGVQQLELTALLDLGLVRATAERLGDAQRPPIPRNVVNRLMHECRRTCCVCRSERQSLVLHHTREWAKSHQNDEEYLVVICTGCHGEAHTRRELGRNLTAEELLGHRKLWASEVSKLDAQALFENNPEKHLFTPAWDYFNHRRIFRIAKDLGIEPTSLPSYSMVRHRSSLDDLGALDWHLLHQNPKAHAHYIYDGDLLNADGTYLYFGELLRRIILVSQWIDLRSIWTPGRLKAVVKPGAVAILTAGFRYRSAGTMLATGPGQTRDAYYKSRGIRINFSFDAWETTSNSSRGNLRGSWISTVVFLIRSLATDASNIDIEATCLGIGTGFDSPATSPPLIASTGFDFDEAESDDEDA